MVPLQFSFLTSPESMSMEGLISTKKEMEQENWSTVKTSKEENQVLQKKRAKKLAGITATKRMKKRKKKTERMKDLRRIAPLEK
jgi:CRISPR/Cas system-associated exonuclease Cas4 (RecB family)